MVLIISSDDDLTTNDVIDWLRFYQKEYIRVDSKSTIDIVRVDINEKETDMCLKIKEKIIKFSEITSVWYRRSWLTIKHKGYRNPQIKKTKLNIQINAQLKEESHFLLEFLWDEIRKKSLNHVNDIEHNKLTTLTHARRYGLNVPTTILTSQKGELLNFKEKYSHIITKNFSPGVFINLDGRYLTGYTIELDDAMIAALPQEFYPMLFQQKIEKAFELRIFYLHGQFYSSAILSQNDDKTKIDFRNYNFEKPNRTPPYILPLDIKKRLTKLMNHFALNSGSIDMIVDTFGNYIFLEINPIGQLAQVSIPCNYYLEKRIAKSLMKNKYE